MTHAPGSTAPDRSVTGPPSSSPNDDEAIVARMAEGDAKALGELYDRWSTLAHSLALRILDDRDDAEDVVEETFWQLWRQAARFDAARGSVATWVATVARSRALDRRRALMRRRDAVDRNIDARANPDTVRTEQESPVTDPAAAAEM